ncbi:MULTISPECIES: Scr1 family TA system antitoxin-like transcriptional regulator [unclassified Actinopolyspora]|uniref:Scr1 family TA system antitoxin-like transcriptional regulator n=1 Tax=unclassified Actinopolyspora TaxID=2639451 RepID=UPI0013F62143|nr:helix-turn-helix domain-containing protein [Actinopolyspora sp. BKK2]NHE75756.1 helix-turn-helix domain-containing protein [Actinopolyspora sp. BKK1]
MNQSPTVHRRRLGGELRRLREAAQRTHREVAAHLDCSQGKISQIELGRVPVRTADVRLMAEFYGSSSEQVSELLELAEASKQRGWWQEHPSTARRSGFDTYLGLETAATALSVFEPDPLPELLQTAEYSATLLRSSREGFTAPEISDRVAVTSKRQQRLLGTDPLELWAVLDEAALRRRVGGSRLMRGQLEHLVLMSYRRNVTVQVLPFDVGAHPFLGERVTVFSFRENTDQQVVHTGGPPNSRFLDKSGETEPYLTAFEQVCSMALPPKESTMLISRIADEQPCRPLRRRATRPEVVGGPAPGK